MNGPFDNIFGNTPFDLNRDGHIDAGEWSLINDTLFSDDTSSYSDDEDDESDEFDSDGLEDELERSGLDLLDLEMMDPEERREALEDAGFDADDFDDFDF